MVGGGLERRLETLLHGSLTLCLGGQQMALVYLVAGDLSRASLYSTRGRKGRVILGEHNVVFGQLVAHT
jgi:hypothetical protein